MNTFLSLLLCFSMFYSCFCNDKIKLTEVQTLTLYANRKTNGRRSSGVPQLECVGGSINCDKRYIPNIVQCTNVGKDEYDVQWTCKAELDTTVKFGHIDVNCEGYDYPNDKYILKGSCGLRYTLDGSGSHNPNSRGKIKDNAMYSDSSFNNVMMIILVIVVVVIIVCWYNSDGTRATSRVSPSCPPPGFRPEYTNPMGSENYRDPPSYNSVFNEHKTRNTESSGPGFWTGLGAGGLMGYMFGSSNRQRVYEEFPSRPQRESRYVNNDRFEDSRSSTPEFRTASGYGGTSRR